jgi:hypothetical protein
MAYLEAHTIQLQVFHFLVFFSHDICLICTGKSLVESKRILKKGSYHETCTQTKNCNENRNSQQSLHWFPWYARISWSYLYLQWYLRIGEITKEANVQGARVGFYCPIFREFLCQKFATRVQMESFRLNGSTMAIAQASYCIVDMFLHAPCVGMLPHA